MPSSRGRGRRQRRPGGELRGGLDAEGVADLWACIADLDRIESRIDSEYCASYFTRLRTMARLVVARHAPAAI
ncbi:hypothetical protein ACFQ7O_14000 [Streptomyces sp. NPDC056485]|uniref:hypothetical protein n=1 Tax=Streptomyces sp. NPDC056485 TaxID=3345834 RepID=UPI0036B6774B